MKQYAFVQRTLFILLTMLLSFTTRATPIYLNHTNISVAVGAGTSAGSFNNTFSGGNTIDKVIGADSADAIDNHNQSSHVWFTAASIGGGLELVFNFGQAYDLTTLHFWNFTGESYDVDNIDFTFYDSSNALLGNLSIMPELGSASGILAQDISLPAPLNVQYVTTFLTGTNRQVDFQNIGFTAELSATNPNNPTTSVPEAPTFYFLLSALLLFVSQRVKRQS